MPFPVSAPFRVRADLAKLGTDGRDCGGGSVAVLDARYPEYARAKLAAWQALGEPPVLRAGTIPPGSEHGRLDDALAVARTVATYLTTGAGGAWLEEGADGSIRWLTSGLLIDPRDPRVPVRPWRDDARRLEPLFATLSPSDAVITSIALSMQEDLASMREHGGPVADWMSVALPSGWDPAEKQGMGLAAIHGPVADGEALRAASQNLARAMVEKGPFLRWVWTLADHPRLSRHPRLVGLDAGAASPEPIPIERICFRCERQTTIPMPDRRAALFLIRVFVAPLAEVAADAERRRTLVDALGSMSDAVVAYKNVARLRDVVLSAWG